MLNTKYVVIAQNLKYRNLAKHASARTFHKINTMVIFRSAFQVSTTVVMIVNQTLKK